MHVSGGAADGVASRCMCRALGRRSLYAITIPQGGGNRCGCGKEVTVAMGVGVGVGVGAGAGVGVGVGGGVGVGVGVGLGLGLAGVRVWDGPLGQLG